jgi:hypothetical protein
MKNYFISLKIDAKVNQSLNTNMSISEPINKSAIEADVLKELRILKLRADVKSFNYVIRDSQLYVEGWAYQDKPLPVIDFLIAG